MGRAFVKEVFQGRETVGDVGKREVTSTVAMMVLGGRGLGRDQLISRKWLVSFM